MHLLYIYVLHASQYSVITKSWIQFTIFAVALTVFSKCFPGAGYMKVGGGLGTEATLSSVLRVQVSSRASGYPSLGKQSEILMLKDAMTEHV